MNMHLYIKRKMLLDRNRTGRNHMCDLCDKYSSALHKHEIINKNRVATESDRDASESMYLSSIICPSCHLFINDEDNRQLLQFNINRYGLAEVKQAFNELSAPVRRAEHRIKDLLDG